MILSLPSNTSQLILLIIMIIVIWFLNCFSVIYHGRNMTDVIPTKFYCKIPGESTKMVILNKWRSNNLNFLLFLGQRMQVMLPSVLRTPINPLQQSFAPYFPPGILLVLGRLYLYGVCFIMTPFQEGCIKRALPAQAQGQVLCKNKKADEVT